MLWHSIWTFVTVFLARHWLTAVVNSGLTALLGLGLLRGAKRLAWPRLSSLTYLRLCRLVILMAILKAAFYMVQGTAAQSWSNDFIDVGFQLPGPGQWIGLAAMSTHNIWHPTTVTAGLYAIAFVLSAACFAWRLSQLILTQRELRNLLVMNGGERDPRLDGLLSQAALAMRMNDRVLMPQIVLVELDYPTPLLLGLRQPWLLISPGLAAELSDLELEMAFRHELAHCLRRDQRWRWIQTWLEDVGRITGLARLLSTNALAYEEQICDLMTITSVVEAQALGRAINKATHFSFSRDAVTSSGTANTAPVPLGRIDLPEHVIPALLGWSARTWTETAVLKLRIEALTTQAHRFAAAAQEADLKGADSHAKAHHILRPRALEALSQVWRGAAWIFQALGIILFGLLLFFILYVKFHILLRGY